MSRLTAESRAKKRHEREARVRIKKMERRNAARQDTVQVSELMKFLPAFAERPRINPEFPSTLRPRMSFAQKLIANLMFGRFGRKG